MRVRFFIILLIASSLLAASAAAAANPKPKTRTVETLSQSVYDEITRAQKLSRDKKHNEALTNLQVLLKSNTSNKYERALVLQQEAFVWAALENYTKAISLLNQVLEQAVLSAAEKQSAQFNLAQIYLAAQNYPAAIKTLNQLISKKKGKKVSGDTYALLAHAWALAGEFKRATPYAEKAVRSRKRPRKNWLRLLTSLYLQQNLYAKALPIAERGAVLYPTDNIFWLQLADLYAQQKKMKKSFTALRTMYQLKLFTKPSHYRRLAQNYLAFGAPAAAARILEAGFAKNILEKNHKNYILLGDAWRLARQWHKAIRPLRAAAPLVPHGKIWQKLGDSYLQAELWQKAERAFMRALDQGDLKREGRAWLLLGITRAKQNKQDQAFAALDRAITFDDVSDEAKAWIDNLYARQK